VLQRNAIEEGNNVNEHDSLSAQFEEHRSHLHAVAYRMLGSQAEADDAVQETWLRLSRSDAGTIENLGGWLTTVVARISLDLLRSRAARREELSDASVPEPIARPSDGGDPEGEALLADSLGPALLVVLDTLTPSERLAFVLHDVFAVSFEEIGIILSRSPNAAKQLASRARNRVQGATPLADPDTARQREVVDAFLAASRSGDFEALLAVLDPDIELRADAAGIQMGADGDVRGAAAVAGVFSGRALGAQPALVDGAVGIAWAPDGSPKVVWDFTIAGGKVTRIDMIAEPATLDELDLFLFDN
jgi:RNA polymerase sigma factor (sigma-70 family)